MHREQEGEEEVLMFQLPSKYKEGKSTNRPAGWKVSFRGNYPGRVKTTARMELPVSTRDARRLLSMAAAAIWPIFDWEDGRTGAGCKEYLPR